MNRFSWGKLGLGCAAATLICALCFGTAPESGLLITIWFSLPILFAWVYGYTGYFPAQTLGIMLIVCAWSELGIVWAICLALTCLAPVLMMALYSGLRVPFFKQLRLMFITLAAGVASTLVLLMIIYGTDLIGVAAENARAAIRVMDAEAIEQAEKYILDALARLNFTLEAGEEGLLMAFADVLEQLAKIYAPALIALYCALNGTLGVLWLNYLRARRGEDNVDYVPVNEWKLPASTTLGLILAFITTWIMSYMGRVEFVLVYDVVKLCVRVAFIAQACGSILRKLKKAGVSPGKRTTLIVLLIIPASTFLALYGALSALIGVNGAIRPFIQSYIDKKRKDKEE